MITTAPQRGTIETLKLIGFSILIALALATAFWIGQSRLPKSEYCEINYRLDGTWEPVGWNADNGFPEDCKLMTDRFTELDGTWDWK